MALFIEALIKKEQSDIEKIRKEAMQRAKEIALLLKERYGVRKIILFGSLVKKAYLHKRTDIDLLVEGLPEELFLKAGAEAMKLASPYDVDIIPLERASKFIIEKALEEGIEL